MAEIHFHDEARAEFLDAVKWYGSRSSRTAIRFIKEVDRMLGCIDDAPEHFPRYDADHRFAILKRFPFSIIYEFKEPYIQVIAVAHASRAEGYWQERS